MIYQCKYFDLYNLICKLLINKCFNPINIKNNNSLLQNSDNNEYDFINFDTLVKLKLRKHYIGGDIKITVSECLTIINKFRNKELCDINLVRTAVNLMDAVVIDSNKIPSSVKLKYKDEEIDYSYNFYDNEFVPYFLEQSNTYYSLVSIELVKKLSVSDYLTKINDIYNSEENMINLYLRNSTVHLWINEIFNKVFLISKIDYLLSDDSKGLNYLLENKLYFSIEILNKYFRNLDEIKRFTNCIEKYLLNSFNNILHIRYEKISKLIDKKKEKTSDNNYMISILKLYKEALRIVQFFENKQIFEKIIYDVFKQIFNTFEGTKCAITNTEMLCHYMDNIIKNPKIITDESELQNELSLCCELHKYTPDKDVFIAVYKELLSSRLLNKKSADESLENFVVSNLKSISGISYVSKIETMINDIRISQTNIHKLKPYYQSYKDEYPELKNTEFEVNVLNFACWPKFPNVQIDNSSEDRIILPHQLKLMKQIYVNYYKKVASSKCLQWLYSTGKVTLRRKYKGKNYEYTVVPLQAIVLIAFNGPFERELTYQDISEKTNISIEILKRVLDSLTRSRSKKSTKPDALLLKVKSTITNEEESSSEEKIKHIVKFKKNPHYESKLIMNKIPMASLANFEKVTTKVVEDRRYVIEAVIVRIMKTRKTLSHVELVSESINVLKDTFKPNIKNIKKKIEDLIEREYLERDETDPKIYHYLS